MTIEILTTDLATGILYYDASLTCHNMIDVHMAANQSLQSL